MFLGRLVLAICITVSGVIGQQCPHLMMRGPPTPEAENTHEKVIVDLKHGQLRGYKKATYINRREYFAFQGVPYAQPPLNELRFKPPQKPTPWEGVYDATRSDKKCPQNDAFFEFYSEGDEDCLFLNIYTPSLVNDELLPVMFWIHNGGFTTGSGCPDLFGPDFLIEEDVILVTINYRLGALGFMNLEDEFASGNMGLKDAVMALKWVRDNIHVFGGDNQQVTIFGNEAGGSMVSLILHCPQAKGLFSKAICQSGVARMPNLFDTNTRQHAFDLGRHLRKNVTTSQALVKGLQKADLYEMARVTPYIIDSSVVRDAQKPVLPFAPSVEKGSDNPYIDKFPEDFSAKDVSDVPLMIGFNSKESVTYLKDLVNSPDVLEKKDYNFQFLVPIRDLQFEYKSEDYNSVAAEIKKFYFDGGVIKNSSINEYVDYVSDNVFYPIDKTVDSYLSVERKKPIFYYRFSFNGDLNIFNKLILDDKSSIKGASNGDEICYLFMCAKYEPVYEYLNMWPDDSKELKTLKRMTRLWTNFAKYGNPTPGFEADKKLFGDLKWMQSTKHEHQVLDIGEDLTMLLNPVDRSVHFWDNIYGTFLMKKNQPHFFRDEL